MEANQTENKANHDLESLRNAFQNLRTTNAPRQKVPERLRRKVLKALSLGASETDIRSALGVTRAQLTSWKQAARPPKAKESLALPNPRILEVTPASSEQSKPPSLRVSCEPSRLVLEFSF